MDKVKNNGKMETNIMELGKMILEKVQENLLGKMGIHMTVYILK